jgi:hypothetical protein
MAWHEPDYYKETTIGSDSKSQGGYGLLIIVSQVEDPRVTDLIEHMKKAGYVGSTVYVTCNKHCAYKTINNHKLAAIVILDANKNRHYMNWLSSGNIEKLPEVICYDGVGPLEKYLKEHLPLEHR